jgi:hypothetical protein
MFLDVNWNRKRARCFGDGLVPAGRVQNRLRIGLPGGVRLLQPSPLAIAALAAALSLGCSSGSPTETDPLEPPPAGPHFTESPLPIETVARITPLGYNNKIIPTSHSYWLTCDIDIILQGSRPCHMERQDVRAPTDGTVIAYNPAEDGFIRIEGPKGLRWTFGHVTPAPGLTPGSRVRAGQVIGRMTFPHGVDFGVVNYGVRWDYVRPERYPEEYRYGQHPVEQFGEPLRSELAGRSNSRSRPLGGLDFDVPGTVSGGWFRQGLPVSASLDRDTDDQRQWFGRWIENEETRVVAFGHRWSGMVHRWAAADSAAPSWETLTPVSGRVAVRLWAVNTQAQPDPNQQAGTVLLEMLGANTLRLEWFASHAPVSAFTAAALTYER